MTLFPQLNAKPLSVVNSEQPKHRCGEMEARNNTTEVDAPPLTKHIATRLSKTVEIHREGSIALGDVRLTYSSSSGRRSDAREDTGAPNSELTEHQREGQGQTGSQDLSHGSGSIRPKRKRSAEDYNIAEIGAEIPKNEGSPAKRSRTANHSGLDQRETTTGPEGKRSRITGRSIAVKDQVTVRSLPLELLCLIVEELWDDTTNECQWDSTLCACALTCLSWRAAARPLIFRFLAIKNSLYLHKLAHQIRQEPRIAYWIRRLRFEGKSIPRVPVLIATQQSSVKQDVDTWLYSFFSVVGVDLPNIKYLDLFGFQHLSLRRDDCEAFARWIPQLASLRSVESLQLARCEMPPNALTAIARAFPKLRNVAFTCVSFWFSDGAELAVTPEVPLLGLSSPGETSGSTRNDAIKYPVLHEPPRLHSLSVDNSLANYSAFDFSFLQDWLYPPYLAESLQYLHIGSDIIWDFVAQFIASLGASPVLHTLRMSVELTEELRDLIELDISNLTNVKYFTVDCLRRDPFLDADMVRYLCQLFTQINIPYLEEATVGLCSGGLKFVKELDEFLSGEKFRDLKRLNVSIAPRLAEVLQDLDAVETVKSLFPNMEARRILRVVEPPPPPRMP